MIISTKKRSTKYHSNKYHTAYGIQNWLCANGYCLAARAKYKVNKNEYKELLREFILYDNPDFDFTKLKHGIESMERYIQNDFNKFCSFTTNKYKQEKS